MINKKRLQLFVLTSKYGNLSQAAAELAMSQSAASMSLAQLESSLGAPLFHRVGKRLWLNDAGKRVLPKAIDLLVKFDELENIASNEYEAQGHLHIVASTTIAEYVLPNLVYNFTRQYPKVLLELTVCTSSEAAHKISTFEADCGLVEGLKLLPNLRYIPWVQDTLAVFCHPEHPLASQKAVTAADLMHYPWAMRESSSGTRQILESVLASTLPTEIRILSSSSVIRQVVEQDNRLIACLSRYCLRHSSVVDITPRAWKLQRYFYYIDDEARNLGHVASLFLKHINLS